MALRPFLVFAERVRKDEKAREIAERSAITEGLVCVMSMLDPAAFRLDDDPRKRSAQISRLLHRLHFYRLIAQVPRSRRWRFTDFGRRVLSTARELRYWAFPDAWARRLESAAHFSEKCAELAKKGLIRGEESQSHIDRRDSAGK